MGCWNRIGPPSCFFLYCFSILWFDDVIEASLDTSNNLSMTGKVTGPVELGFITLNTGSGVESVKILKEKGLKSFSQVMPG